MEAMSNSERPARKGPPNGTSDGRENPHDKPPEGDQDQYAEWNEVAKELRKDAEEAIDAMQGLSKQEADWFEEGDKEFDGKTEELRVGEGFTERDKKWFAEGDRPWKGDSDEPPDETPGAARR